MRLLLDTHVWIWSMSEPERLGSAAKAAMRERGAELWLSPISIWEALVLQRKGRIELRSSLDEMLRDQQSRGIMRIAPVTVEVALGAGRLKLDHQDPADNLLAATALVQGLTLVTADRKLLACGQIECVRV